MRIINYSKNIIPLIALIGMFFGLTSCGSYQHAGQDNDGIYKQAERQVDYERDNTRIAENNSGNYYKNYFREKSLEYDYLTAEDEIFTDIDSYEGDYNVQNDSTEFNYNAYAGWGQNSSDVEINVYNNSGFGYGGFWWHRPYYNNWAWNYGWGSYGFYDPFWCPPFYGVYSFYSPYRFYNPYYYNLPYYNNRFYNNYYSRNGVAYNASRRGSIYTNRNNNRVINRSSSSNIRRNSTARYLNTTRRSSTSTNRSSSTRPRVNTNTQRRSSNATSRNTTPRRTTRTQPSSSNNRSSTISRSPSRSSGSVSRSSRSGSSRSSGSSSSVRRPRR